jgi:hypothetical protein
MKVVTLRPLYPLEKSTPSIHTGQEAGWGPKADPDNVKRKIFPLPEIKPRPSSPSLYRLSYLILIYIYI